MELLNNTTFLNEREKKLKEILIKNEILKNKRKENIMNQIHEKERNIDNREKIIEQKIAEVDQIKNEQNGVLGLNALYKSRFFC